jgi:hypothetical protein
MCSVCVRIFFMAMSGMENYKNAYWSYVERGVRMASTFVLYVKTEMRPRGINIRVGLTHLRIKLLRKYLFHPLGFSRFYIS